MKVYMLQRTDTKEYYQRGGYYGGWTKDPQRATIWLTPHGPIGSKGTITRYHSLPRIREAKPNTIILTNTLNINDFHEEKK